MLLNHFTHKNKAELLFKMDIYTKDTNNFKKNNYNSDTSRVDF